MSFLHCSITALCFQNGLGSNCTTAFISLPQFGCLKGERDCRFGSCWHKEPGVLCSRRRVLAPWPPRGTAQSQHREEQSCGCSSPSVQPASLVQVWEPPRGENTPEGLFVTSGGQVWRRHHPGIPDWNLLQTSETPAQSSYCCFIYHLNVCHLLSFSVASYLLCAWSHAEVHYLEKLN